MHYGRQMWASFGVGFCIYFVDVLIEICGRTKQKKEQKVKLKVGFIT